MCYFSHILPMRPTEAECIWGSGARFPAGLWTRDVSRGKTQFHLVNHLEHFFQTIDVHADLAGHRHQRRIPSWDHTPLTSDMLCCITSNLCVHAVLDFRESEVSKKKVLASVHFCQATYNEVLASGIMVFRQLHIRCSKASRYFRIFQCDDPTAY